MKMFELDFDGQLTRNMITEYGEELTIAERLNSKAYGLGHLEYRIGNSILDEFYLRYNNKVKTNFDWTKRGAIIRFRTSHKIFATGFRDEQINWVSLTKDPDYIYATPFFPFWILIAIRVPFNIAKWFMIRGDKYKRGLCTISIRVDSGQNLVYELNGDLWKDCVKTFTIARIKERTTITDKRTWITENGIEVR